MTWVSDYKYHWYEQLALKILQSGGHIPLHVAFVMDGNRRYAQSEQIRKIDGHSRGFYKLADCLRWCLDLGIKEVTTFAFSIENFKRSEDEVTGLMNLAREKFTKLLNESDKLKEHGVRIRVIGNIALLPEDLQQLMAKAMISTESNDKLFLNIAFSYTSRDEITQAVEMVLQHGDDLQTNDIDIALLDHCMYSRHSRPPDLLFRTSGETRISDFLMWQLTNTVLHFTKSLWPELTIWNFFTGVFSYQRARLQSQFVRERDKELYPPPVKTNAIQLDRIQNFVQRIDTYRRAFLLRLSNN